MEYRNNFLYLLLDKPQPYAGYVLMSVDTSVDPTLRNKKCQFLAGNAFWNTLKFDKPWD